MEYTQATLNWIFGAVSSLFAWLAKELWSSLKETKEELDQLKQTLPEKYVMKEDFKDFKTEIVDLLHRIENKIDRKQDK